MATRKVTHESPTETAVDRKNLRDLPTRSNLTEKRIGDLESPTAGELVVFDVQVKHLAIRLRPRGSPRWYVYARRGGRLSNMALGGWPAVTVDQARILARKALADLGNEKDPIAERRAARQRARTVARGGQVPILDVLARHLDKVRERGRSTQHAAELERVATAADAAGIRDLAAPDVAARAERWLKSLDVSDLTRHRYRVHLIALGKTALRWWPAEVLPREPFLALSGKGAKLPPPPVFQPDECVQLVSDAALADVVNGGLLWAFLLFTGCRYKEAAWARWDRLDLDRATFAVVPPDAEEREAGARVKRDKARTVALQPELVDLLRSHQRAGFVVADRWRQDPHVNHVLAFRRHLEILGIPLGNRRIHALRHTHACLAIAAGEDSLRLRLSMGHAGPEMQSHYASQAMRWRKLLADWNGTFRLRDPAQVQRLTADAAPGESPSTDQRMTAT